MHLRTCLFSVSLLAFSSAASAQSSGEVCKPGTDPTDTYACVPANLENGDAEYEQIEPKLVNGERGDLLVSAGCGGMTTALLRSMGSDYSHAGILLSPHEVRHSASSDEWLLEKPEREFGLDLPLDGLQPDALRFQWPGTITQDVQQVVEGDFAIDPDTGRQFMIDAFDSSTLHCEADPPQFPLALIKGVIPQTEGEWDEEAVRTSRQNIAEQVEGIEGHHRLGAFTNGSSLGDASEEPWFEQATASTTAAQLLWLGARAAAVHLEGSLEQEDCVDVLSECVVGSSQTDPAHDGLYSYDSDTRELATEALADRAEAEIKRLLRESDMGFSGEIISLLEEPLEEVRNQVANCFAFDWCGSDGSPTDLDGKPADCDEDSDPLSSACWSSPGEGRTVLPDDLLRWDGPDKDPAGVYGAIELAIPRLNRWQRVYRWQRADGLGEVKGSVLLDGAPHSGAEVRIVNTTSHTTGLGNYELYGVDPGVKELQACWEETPGNWVSGTRQVTVVANEVIEAEPIELTNAGCPFNVHVDNQRYRKVTVSGDIHVRDWEDILPNQEDTKELQDILQLPDELLTVLLCTDSPHECQDREVLSFATCIGGEVRAEVDLTLSLVDDVRLSASAEVRLYETQEYVGSCWGTDDLDGHNGFTKVQETLDDVLEFTEKVKNTEEDDPDRITLNFTVTNERWTDPIP